jgi:peptidyl-prolyl cis-trans isomerase SurA
MNWALLLVVMGMACKAEIIDRIAVVVGNSVITESEILREIRLTAFLNSTPLDFSLAAKRKTAERLVEQHLIAAEAQASAYPAPDPDELEESVKQTRDRFPSPASFKDALARAGITEDQLKDHLSREIRTLGFLDFRFRPGIQINDDEIARYFAEHVEPELEKKQPGMKFSVDNYRAQIEQTLVGERLDKAADAWLKESHERTHVEFRPDVFPAEPPKVEAAK